MRKRNMIFPFFMVIMITMALFVFNSCYKDYGLSTADYDTVMTLYNEEKDFQGYTTYDIDENWTDLNDPDNPSPANPANASSFLAAIRNEMTNYGWTEVPSGTEEVTINLAYSETANYYLYCTPSYGWYYYPGWCGYGYTYSGGTAIIQMVDPNDPDGDGNLLALWQAGINAVLDDSVPNLIQRIYDTVAQAYVQSPYLNRN